MKTSLWMMGAVLAVGAMGVSARASSVTVSGSDFNGANIFYGASGTGTAGYSATPTGHAALSTGPSGNLLDNQAVVGVTQSFGDLRYVSMSFTAENQTGNSEQPYAAFKLDANGDGSHYLLVLSLENAPDLNSGSSVHVFDFSSGLEADNTTWGQTLSSLYDTTYTNGTKFGDMNVVRSYVYIGEWADTGYKTADITSITVNTASAVPLPASVWSGMALLAGLGIVSRVKKARVVA
ncbi:MAG: hypothetical protein ACTHN5_19560 [Phycisphaerae bacterium]